MSFPTVTSPPPTAEPDQCADDANLRRDPPDPTFYDDREVRYTLGARFRTGTRSAAVAAASPLARRRSGERILMVTGSQPAACRNLSAIISSCGSSRTRWTTVDSTGTKYSTTTHCCTRGWAATGPSCP
ncbi:galactomannan galactosyltransferase 1-like [Prunus yedoensis var. nudiflora]|uniref:Galactomannan galactosyltransferase 1-like n=1 Tax=Prunus yedoensis var. nudiflora TaxID=2094558 RepID=A0A314Z6H2_PRUYE|nr:galactomannan galactosyltransferase 1-like [Prunus yedoensis var. nudiflora]